MWLPDDVKIKDIANESRKTTPVVLFDDVRFGYDEHAVLDHVSFHVEEGERDVQEWERVRFLNFCLDYMNRRREKYWSVESLPGS